jgi:hypothetical protein
MTQLGFLASILFLWSLAMLMEFREIFNLHRHLHSIPNLPANIAHSEQVLEKDEAGQISYYLVAFSPVTRHLIYSIIIIPKYVICALLTFIGWRWLSASESFADLILNSLALQFVVTIDELIFASVFPERMTEKVSALKMAVPREQFATEEEKLEQDNYEIRRVYARSVLFLIFIVTLLGAYLVYLQQVIPGYQWDLKKPCASFHDGGNSLICPFLSGKDCFPKGPKRPEL